MNFEPARRVLDGLGVLYALIGAHAMAARGYSRFTLDVDLPTTDSRVFDALESSICCSATERTSPLSSASGSGRPI